MPILSRFDKTIGIPKDSKQLKTELKKKERKKAKTFLETFFLFIATLGMDTGMKKQQIARKIKWKKDLWEINIGEDNKKAIPSRMAFNTRWQSCKDSNLNKMNQNHLCYRYTTGLTGGVNRNRTGLGDFADRCLTSWLSRLVL